MGKSSLKSRKLLVSVFIVAIIIIGVVATFVFTYPKGPYEISQEQYKIKVGYIKASSDYEYGLKAGKIYANAYKQLFENVQRTKLTPAQIKEHLKTLEKYYPAQLERLKGLSESAGYPVEELLSLTGGAESLCGCTTSASAPPATVNDEVFLTWNVDGEYSFKALYTDIFADAYPEVDAPIYLGGMPAIFVKDIKGYNKVVCRNLPIVGEMGLMNDKGLAAVINACWVREEEGCGLTRKEALSKVMETCSDVYQAAELLNSASRFSKFGIGEDRQHQWNYLFADANGGIASVEATHNYFAVRYGKETRGILASGNHHQFLDYNTTGSWSKERKPNGYKSSWIRTGRMWDLLKENYGKIDFEKVVSFTKDTANGPAPGIGGYDSICRYEERDMKEKCPGFTPDTYEKGTCFAFVIQPKERVIWWCGSHPDEAPYIKIDVGKCFSRK